MADMTSSQTLSEADRRVLAGWAATCAERALPLLDTQGDADRKVRDALRRAHAFARGESTAAEEIRQRMVAVSAAGAADTPAGAAAARAIAQAAAVAHMGAHALGAAAYAVRAMTLSRPDEPEVATQEVDWQLAQLSDDARAALRRLPSLGSDSSGPLGPGLLSRGVLGDTIRSIQAAVTR